MAVWPYTTQRWQRLRQAKLRESPLCKLCLEFGRLEPATVADHVTPIKAGGDPYPPLSGLMSFCVPCHNTKTRVVGRKLMPKVVNGCDVNGRPDNQNIPGSWGR
jgi:5-methylcytosine-specific restriction endonuclease McrA